MKICFIANPVEYDLKGLETVIPSTTAILGNTALKRNHQVYTISPQSIDVYQNQVRGKVKQIENKDMRGFCLEAFDQSQVEDFYLNEMDVILIRSLPGEIKGKTDSESQLDYINLMGLLENLSGPYMVNDPTGIKVAYDKTALLRFPNIIPETSILSNPEEIYQLVKHYGIAVTKPLSGYGGEGIEKHSLLSDDLVGDLVRITDNGLKNVIVQNYVDGVEKFGDKRIFVWRGEPLGGFARIPKKGDFRSNVHVGAKIVKTELSDRDYEICSEVKPFLLENGLELVGIDVVGDYLMEINVRSPGGIVSTNYFNNVSLDDYIVQEIEKLLE